MREGQFFKFRGECFEIRKIFADGILALNINSKRLDIKKFPHFKIVKGGEK